MYDLSPSNEHMCDDVAEQNRLHLILPQPLRRFSYPIALRTEATGRVSLSASRFLRDEGSCGYDSDVSIGSTTGICNGDDCGSTPEGTEGSLAEEKGNVQAKDHSKFASIQKLKVISAKRWKALVKGVKFTSGRKKSSVPLPCVSSFSPCSSITSSFSWKEKTTLSTIKGSLDSSHDGNFDDNEHSTNSTASSGANFPLFDPKKTVQTDDQKCTFSTSVHSKIPPCPTIPTWNETPDLTLEWTAHQNNATPLMMENTAIDQPMDENSRKIMHTSRKTKSRSIGDDIDNLYDELELTVSDLDIVLCPSISFEDRAVDVSALSTNITHAHHDFDDRKESIFSWDNSNDLNEIPVTSGPSHDKDPVMKFSPNIHNHTIVVTPERSDTSQLCSSSKPNIQYKIAKEKAIRCRRRRALQSEELRGVKHDLRSGFHDIEMTSWRVTAACAREMKRSRQARAANARWAEVSRSLLSEEASINSTKRMIPCA